MKNFNYKKALEYNAEQVIAVLPWCSREMVCVKDGKEVDWLNRPEGSEWKPLWKVIAFYPYTTYTHTNLDKETSHLNFEIGGFHDDTRDLAERLYDIWFGYVERKYRKSDNKTALKLQNRITGQIIYMGWYDGRFTVSELEPKTDSFASIVEINED